MISTPASIDELTAAIEKVVVEWRQKEPTNEPFDMSGFLLFAIYGGIPTHRVLARPPRLQIVDLGLGDTDSSSQANVFAATISFNKSLNPLHCLLKSRSEATTPVLEQDSSFPSIALVGAPSTEAAEKLNKGSIAHVELALREDELLESISGEKEIGLEVIVVLEKEGGGWTEAARIQLAEGEEDDDEAEQ